MTRFVTWPEEDGKIRKQQTNKTDETHLRSFRFFEGRCVETPSPSKSLKSRQVQLGVEMSISCNTSIIIQYISSSPKFFKKNEENAFVRATPTAYRRRLWSPFKIFRGLRMLRMFQATSGSSWCFFSHHDLGPDGLRQNEEKTCFDSKSSGNS